MVSNISFGSTYKVSTMPNGYDKFWDFQKFALNKEMQTGTQVRFNDKYDSKTKQYSASYTMVVPDSMDDEIETFCANRGIQFKKLNTQEIMQKGAVLLRISDAPKGMRKVKIDAVKLFELAKNQQNNFNYCEKDYYNYYMDNVDFMLKSGEEIPATTLLIHPSGSSIDDTLDYINIYGADGLNDNQLFVDFNQRTDNPDHCVFFALKNLGIKEVPMYVDNDTYKLANALGILK